jgi:phytoene dehydrogenase-like protein
VRSRYDAVIVGAGPNGLAAGIVLAQAGRSVLIVEAAATPGGGARTAELTLPGFRHDICSAIHPLGVGSPFFRSLALDQHGLVWRHPELPVAHPLDGGKAGCLERSLDATVERLGPDGPAYRRLVGPLVEHWDELIPDLLRPVTRLPRHPLRMLAFGARAVRSARALADAHFRTDVARGLFAGLSGHAIAPLDGPLTASFGLLFAASAHAVGWPAPEGGAQRLIDALASLFRSLSGELVCGHPVQRLNELPDSRTVLFDTSAHQLMEIAQDALPESYQRAVGRFPRGAGVFKVDYALSGPVPWDAESCRRAGTVHVGGTFDEIALAEAQVAAGSCPERPYLLVAQQSVFDATRAPAGQHTLWAYCHVPNGSTEDMSPRIEAQLERFAPGFKTRVLARATAGPAQLERYNANYRGGDIAAGATAGLSFLLRPVRRWNPYATPNPRLFLCSASTPPGPGVHGMCGFHAAHAALAGQ